MRSFIFQFKQETLINLKINLRQALLLDYLSNFFGSGFAVILRKKVCYCWIAYEKILHDLPLVYNNKKQISRDLFDLAKKQIIKKEVHNKKLYIWIDVNYIIFEKKNEIA